MPEPDPFESAAELERRLSEGAVIELAMPSDAVGLLLRDAARGKYSFVWVRCFHGQDEGEPVCDFDSVEQALLWVVSRLSFCSMTRPEAERRYGEEVIRSHTS